jgi:multiple sugar transport system permease protein
MATLALPTNGRTGPAWARACPRGSGWGLILLAPYALVFVIFVVYPIGYGLWLARHPVSYEKLFDDPCSSARSSIRWRS